MKRLSIAIAAGIILMAGAVMAQQPQVKYPNDPELRMLRLEQENLALKYQMTQGNLDTLQKAFTEKQAAIKAREGKLDKEAEAAKAKEKK